MNREDIIRMAREAGLLVIGTAEGSEAVYTWPQGITDELQRFADLVAAAEREKVAAWVIQRGYATGHGDTTENLLKELDWQIDARIAAEREACAQVAMLKSINGIETAAAIRARGQA